MSGLKIFPIFLPSWAENNDGIGKGTFLTFSYYTLEAGFNINYQEIPDKPVRLQELRKSLEKHVVYKNTPKLSSDFFLESDEYHPNLLYLKEFGEINLNDKNLNIFMEGLKKSGKNKFWPGFSLIQGNKLGEVKTQYYSHGFLLSSAL